MVCEKTADRSSTHMALSLGKLLGSAFFGIVADKYGRKICYAVGIIMLITSGPAGAVVPWYWAFIISRLINGASHAAIQYSSFTTRKLHACVNEVMTYIFSISKKKKKIINTKTFKIFYFTKYFNKIFNYVLFNGLYFAMISV